ncbi:MAG: hypothetical protein ABNH53_02450 [Henriciella sp.]|jgi:ABC-type molybdate transport system ATPase subunit
MTLKKTLLCVSTLAVSASPAFARTNAACVSTGEHLQSILALRTEATPRLLSGSSKFTEAQAAVLNEKNEESAVAYSMDVDALRAQSLQERDAMKAQLNQRYGLEVIYRDYIVMLENCAKLSAPNDLGQSVTEFQDTISQLEGLIG